MLGVFEQVCILLIFCVVGYVLCKLHVGNADHTKLLSVLVVYVFGPCVTLNSFTKNFTVAYITDKYPLLIGGLFLVVIIYFATKPISRKLSPKPYNQNIYHYSLIVPNLGYMGYPLCVGILGEEALLDYIIFTLPFNIYIYSIGFATLTNGTADKLSLRKVITSPSLIACAIGAIIGIAEIKLPYALYSAIEQSGNCMAPMSMLMTGMIISQYDLKVLFWDKKAYLISALRLLIIPGAVSLLFKGLGWILPLVGLGEFQEITATINSVAVLATCLSCGMNTVIFPRMVGEDCKIGASSVLISTLASLITIPLCMTFLM